MLYAGQGRTAEAEAHLKYSLSILENVVPADNPEFTTILSNLAVFYFKQGDWRRAIHFLRRSTAVIARRAQHGPPSANQKSGEAIQDDASVSSYDFSLLIKAVYRLKEELADDNASETFQAAQLAAIAEAAPFWNQIAISSAKGNTALEPVVTERQDLLDERQRLDVARSAAVAKVSYNPNRQKRARYVAKAAEIDHRITAIEGRLTSDFPNYAALAIPQALSKTRVQKYLKKNEALVLFFDTPAVQPTPEEIFVWVVTQNDSRWVRSELNGTSLARSVKALRCGLDEAAWKGTACLDILGSKNGGPDDDLLPYDLHRAHKLYQVLLGHSEDLIAGKDLLIVPSGPLTQLPFQVLVTDNPEANELSPKTFSKTAWLIKKHAITVLPSVSSLEDLRGHAKASKATKSIVGFGNPLLYGDGVPSLARVARDVRSCTKASIVRTASLRSVQRTAILPLGHSTRLANLNVLRIQSPLPQTVDELCAVAHSTESDVRNLFLGQIATEANIKSLSTKGELAKFKTLHFATHGALAGELSSNAEPGLILTPPAKASRLDDGYLSASEVAGLKLDADWVILSASNTASGDTQHAEALSGLAKAFFYAGARSLLVSHWYAERSAIVDLLTAAYRKLREDPDIGRAKAMQLAMVSLLRNGGNKWHPSYWAPFMLVGEGAE